MINLYTEQIRHANDNNAWLHFLLEVLQTKIGRGFGTKSQIMANCQIFPVGQSEIQVSRPLQLVKYKTPRRARAS